MVARRVLITALLLACAGGAAQAAAPAAAPMAAPKAAPATEVRCPDITGPVSEADIHCALARWVAAGNRHSPGGVTELYAPDHVLLLSTLHPEPYTTTPQIRAYFQALVTRPGFGVALTPQPEKVDLFTGGGADSGFYKFRWLEGGVEKVTPARFTFVFVLDPARRQLVIATHHSSALPAGHAKAAPHHRR